MKSFRAPVFVISIALAAAGVACSSGPTAKNAASTKGGSATATGAASTTSPAAPSAAPSSGGSEAAFCSQQNIANVGVDFDNADPGSAIASLQKAVTLAPPEIRPEVQTIADVDIPIFQGRVPQDQIDQRVGDPKVVAALKDIATWAAAHCR